MITREVVANYVPLRDVALKSSPNWTAVIFFATLCVLHLSISIPVLLQGRWEGSMSLLLAGIFLIAMVGAYFARFEMMIFPAERRIRLRHGIGALRFQRYVPFSDVHAVRLTLAGGRDGRDSEIEMLCDNEDLRCPATSIPRQQALFLAMLMGVQLIKVSTGTSPDRSDRQL